jgi:hypothetical protein
VGFSIGNGLHRGNLGITYMASLIQLLRVALLQVQAIGSGVPCLNSRKSTIFSSYDYLVEDDLSALFAGRIVNNGVGPFRSNLYSSGKLGITGGSTPPLRSTDPEFRNWLYGSTPSLLVRITRLLKCAPLQKARTGRRKSSSSSRHLNMGGPEVLELNANERFSSNKSLYIGVPYSRLS